MNGHSVKWHLMKLATVASIATLAACGGGGGDSDDGGGTSDDPAPTMPTQLAFSGGLVAGTTLTVAADGDALPVTAFGFDGTWDRTTERVTLPVGNMTTDLGPLGALVARVSATASWIGVPPPVESGAVEVENVVEAGETLLFPGLATLTATSDTTVRLSWSGSIPPTVVDTTWDGFLDADPAVIPEWQFGLQAGVSLLALGVQQTQTALDLFVAVNALDAQLVSAGSAGVTQPCAGGVGTRKVVWNDLNGDGRLGPADGFTATYAGCRVDLPGDIDELLDGQVVIRDYIENASPFSVGGRVDLVNLQQTETDAEAYTLTTNGSLTMFVSAAP